MPRIMSLISLSFICLSGGCGAVGQMIGSEPDATAVPEPVQSPAIAPLRGGDGTQMGQVTLRSGPQGLLLTIEGQGWSPGWHGAHLHAVGTCDGPGFQSAGGHVNHPEHNRPHGLLNWNGGPDYGDLQNVFAHADGTAHAEVYLSHAGRPPSGSDLGDADGLSLVIHVGPDDHVSQPIGGAGARMACAVLAAPISNRAD